MWVLKIWPKLLNRKPVKPMRTKSLITICEREDENVPVDENLLTQRMKTQLKVLQEKLQRHKINSEQLLTCQESSVNNLNQTEHFIQLFYVKLPPLFYSARVLVTVQPTFFVLNIFENYYEQILGLLRQNTINPLDNSVYKCNQNLQHNTYFCRT